MIARKRVSCWVVGAVLGRECMRDLCLEKDCSGRRIRWDSRLVIRSRGRWGKCG